MARPASSETGSFPDSPRTAAQRSRRRKADGEGDYPTARENVTNSSTALTARWTLLSAIFLGMCALSLSGFFGIREIDRRRVEAEAGTTADEVAARFAFEMMHLKRAIRLTARQVGVILTHETIKAPFFMATDYESFLQAQSEALDALTALIQSHPHLYAAGVAPRLLAADLPIIQDWLEARMLGFPAGTLRVTNRIEIVDGVASRTPAPNASEYLPVTFHMDFGLRAKAIAMLDFASVPARAAMLNYTFSTGEHAASNISLLVAGDRGSQFDRQVVFYAIPPCNSSALPTTACLDEPHDPSRVLGVLSTVLDHSDLLDTIVASLPLQPWIAIQLAGPRGGTTASWRWPSDVESILAVQERSIPAFQGQSWTVRVAVAVVDRGVSHSAELSSSIVLVSGLALSSLLLFVVVHYFKRIDKLNAQRIRAGKQHAVREEATKHDAMVQFLRATSHEMRTPLHALTMALDELGHAHPHLAEDPTFASSQGSASMLELVVDNVLDVNRVERGEMQLELGKVSLLDLTKSALSVVRASTVGLEDAKLSMDANGSPCDLSAICECDKARILRSLQNLVVNARKFTLQGQIQVKAVCFTTAREAHRFCSGVLPASQVTDGDASDAVAATRPPQLALRIWKHDLFDVAMPTDKLLLPVDDGVSESHSLFYCLYVCDSGRGMSPTEVESCVLPFVHTREANVHGTGLGLHVVLASVLAHKGMLCISSARDVGTGVAMCFATKIVHGTAAPDPHAMAGSFRRTRAWECQGLPGGSAAGVHPPVMPVPLLTYSLVLHPALASPSQGGTERRAPERRDPVRHLARSPSKAASPLSAPTPLPVVFVQPSQRPGRILVVDDQVINAKLLQRQLQRLTDGAVAVDIAHDGLQALETVRSGNIPDRRASTEEARTVAEVECKDADELAVKDHSPVPFLLVLMDLNMPVCDGLEATRAIRQLGKSITQPRIIMVTGNATAADREAALAAGADGFEAKPCPKENLAQHVKDAL